MKIPSWFNQNRFTSIVRVASAVTLISAAAAMAFVAVRPSTAAAPQNETAIAVDPNNPNRIVGGANDYVTRTWSCFVDGTPCSALGDGYSGTYYSNDGGSTWCCNSNPDANYTPTSDPAQIGTL